MKFRVDEITNQRGAKAFLLRTSFREGRRVRHRTVANLTPLPRDVIGGLRVLLGGGAAFDPAAAAGVSIRRSLPHGHVAAALAVCRRLGLGRILSRRGTGSPTWPWPPPWRGFSSPPPSSPPPGPCRRRPPPRASARCWAWARCPATRRSPCWTGCARASPGSRPPWPGGT